jgi:Sec-independent protein translocase protein TatA
MTMRKVVLAMTMACLGISLLLLGPADLPAQWGAIQQGIDAAKGAKQTQEPAKKEEASGIPNLAQTGPVNQAPVTYKNTARKFSFTLPAGWEPVKDPNANDISVGKPGTRSALTIHITQMVPSFPAKASVDASLKTAKEEVTINKLLSAKRRDDPPGPNPIVIGWETVESPTGGGGSHQRIIWQCYDGQNYYYNFNAATSPEQFNASRAELQGIINSVKFSK